jgi:hypothetical protein
MPKILHIGGVDSPHVVGIVEQIKNLTNFEQSIISYPANIHVFNVTILKDIPKYYYNYPKFFKNKPIDVKEHYKLIKFVRNLIVKEKPDIIHGHYLSKCSTIMYYCQYYSKKPGIVSPWATWDMPRNAHMLFKNKHCLTNCKYVMSKNMEFLYALLDFFKQPRSKAIFAGPPINLTAYSNHIPSTNCPTIYIPRNYYQGIIVKSLVSVLSQYPNIKITALSPNSIIQLSKHLGIYDKINFLPRMLSQTEFSEMIKAHNIIISMAPDGGTSSTTIQAAYSGAVTVVPINRKWDSNTFIDNKNVLKCQVTVQDITKKLIYAIDNLKDLCIKFKKNNDFLYKWDASSTGKNLINAYNNLLV